jgi:predicted phosphodiesterase
MKKKGKATPVATSYALLGDIHGYVKVADEGIRCATGPVIQLGDFGLAPAWTWAKKQKRLLVLGGNHDDYDAAPTTSNYLGDFGDLGRRVAGADGTFFVRGAYSIEREEFLEPLKKSMESKDAFRLSRKSGYLKKYIWGNEELSDSEMQAALSLYRELKPHTVLSHDCPYVIQDQLRHLDIKTRTNDLLQAMYDAHQPDHWFFGHYNYPRSWKVEKTILVCLGTDRLIDVAMQRDHPRFSSMNYSNLLSREGDEFGDDLMYLGLKSPLRPNQAKSAGSPPQPDPQKAEIDKATIDAQNDVFDKRDGVTIRTHCGGYVNRGAFRYEWSDLQRAQCLSDGSWYCIECNKLASSKHDREECHTCRDWNGCGQDCTLSEVYCEKCGASMPM